MKRASRSPGLFARADSCYNSAGEPWLRRSRPATRLPVREVSLVPRGLPVVSPGGVKGQDGPYATSLATTKSIRNAMSCAMGAFPAR